MANNKTSITDLDFDQIKSNLKAYLQTQSEFSDYNFDGSGLSVLLDILAYNTHYNALYVNLAINEMFLDSASKRDSVISIANNYGYLPKSRRCSVAQISMTMPIGANTQQNITIPRFQPFISSINGNEYVMYNRDELVGNKLDNNYIFETFSVYEGTPVSEKFNVVDGVVYQLQNANIDTSTIRVYVKETADSLTTEAYSYSETIIGLNAESKVFFIREIENNKYEISFGKNNLGVEPPVGSIVYIDYMVTNGEEANGLKLFSYGGTTVASGTPVLTVVSSAIGGSEIETIDEIKYNTARKFKTQNRAVTAEDYIDIIKNNYSDIDTISCWSGDEETPPQYGKIFVSIKPKTGPFLVPPEKSYIVENIIKPKSVVGVYPELIDPIYNYISVDTTVYFNPYVTNKSTADIVSQVRNSIFAYNDINLKKFGGLLRYSKFINDIDSSDNSILSNITTLKLRRKVDVIYSNSVKYTFTINNPIYNSGVPEEAIVTNGFYIGDSDTVYYIDDDGVGNLRLYYYSSETYKKIFVSLKIGTVDYDAGVVTVNNLNINGIVESDWIFTMIPHSNDIISKHNQLSLIDENQVNITAIRETRLETRPFTNSR